VGADADHVPYHPEWSYRTELVQHLHKMSKRRSWTFRNPGGRQPKVDRGAMNDFYASATITVGDSLCPLRERSRYWSDRAYEAPGRHGVLVMPRIDALQDQYEDELLTYEWGDWGHLEYVIESLLEDDLTRESAREVTWEIARTTHTYKNRVETMLQTLNLL
jgi:hypothetical protein